MLRWATGHRTIELSKINIIHYSSPFGTPTEPKRMSMRNSKVFAIWWKKAQVKERRRRRCSSPLDRPIRLDLSINCEILHEQTGTPIAQVSPLIIACFEGDADIVRFFIEVRRTSEEKISLISICSTERRRSESNGKWTSSDADSRSLRCRISRPKSTSKTDLPASSLLEFVSPWFSKKIEQIWFVCWSNTALRRIIWIEVRWRRFTSKTHCAGNFHLFAFA